MTVICVEHSNAVEADLSIEYSDAEDTFEVYFNRNPAIIESPSDASSENNSGGNGFDSLSSQREINVTHVDSKDLVIFELVNDQKWARVYGMLENNPSLARIPFLPSSSAFTSDCQNNLLLHHVCKSAAPPEVIECVLGAYTNAAAFPGHNGAYPLHLAVESGVPVTALLKILQAYPPAVQRQEQRKGRLPLHLAAHRGSAATACETLIMLMSYYPEGIVIVDDNEMTPVDYAARIKSTKLRMESLSILEMGQRWIQVAQNVAARLEYSYADKREHLEKNFENFIDSMHSAHEEEVERILEKYLATSMDEVSLNIEIENRKERMAKLDAVFQEKLRTISRREDRFQRLEAKTHAQVESVRTEIRYDMCELADELEESQKAESRLRAQLNEKDKRISELEKQLRQKDAQKNAAVAVKTAALQRSESTRKETDKKYDELKAQFERLQKDLGTTQTLLGRITSLAKNKENQANIRTIELVQIIKEQEMQMNILISKLDFFSDQVSVLKKRLGDNVQ